MDLWEKTPLRQLLGIQESLFGLLWMKAFRTIPFFQVLDFIARVKLGMIGGLEMGKRFLIVRNVHFLEPTLNFE